MDHHVFVEGPLLGEFILANRTFVWSLSTMLHCMPLQTTFIRECLVANCALEWVLPLLVGGHVNIQIGFLRELFLANGAFEGFLSRVDQHVTGQRRLDTEPLFTYFALVRFLTRMG